MPESTLARTPVETSATTAVATPFNTTTTSGSVTVDRVAPSLDGLGNMGRSQASPQVPNAPGGETVVASRTRASTDATPSQAPSAPPSEARCGATLAAGLEARLSARISSSIDEVVAFASPARAVAAVARLLLAGRSVAIGEGTPDDLAAAVERSARSTSRARWLGARPDGVLAALLGATTASDAVVLASPVVRSEAATAAITPRELLQLRARNLRSLLVLDLRDEDLARTPLTPTALLLPGTIAIRGFGEVWREAGAPEVADLAFVAGPAREIAALRSEALGCGDGDRAIVDAACAALDRPDIERRVREVAGSWRGRAQP